jgi:hypothetical protein
LSALKSINSGSGVGTTLRSLLATRIHPEDPNDDNEEYYLVKPIRKPWKTDGKANPDGVMYAKGIYLFQAIYFKFSHTRETDGYRVYTLVDEPGSTVTMDVGCVVCGCGDIQFSHVKRNESQIDEYILSKACDSTITTMGDIHAIY